MATLGELAVKVGVTGLDEFTKAMGTMSDRVKVFDKEFNKTWSGVEKVGERLKDVGGSLTVGVTGPLAALGGASLKVAGDFEKSFNTIQALGDNIVGPSLERLRAQAIDLGAKTAFSAQQAADGMTVFASAGHTAEQILAEMPGTLNLAAAGTLAIADAAEITKNTLGQFQLAAQDAGHIADVLAQAAADTSAPMKDLGTTLTYVGPVAKGAGQSLEETTAAIVALDKAGIQGEKAGTGLRGVIASLIAPSSEAAKVISSLGISVADGAGKVLPLSDIMEQFRQKLATVGSEAEKQRLIFEVFGREAGNAAQVLISTGGPALDEFEKKLVNSQGAAERMAKTMNSGLNYALDQFKGSVETAGIALGTALLPAAGRVLEIGTNLVNNFVLPAVNWFAKLPDPIQNVAIALGALAAAAGPVIFLAGQMITSFTTVAKALGSMSAATGGQAESFNLLRGAMSNVLPVAVSLTAALITFEQLKLVSAEVQGLGQELIKLATGLADVTGLTEAFRQAMDSATANVIAHRDATASSFEKIVASIRSAVGESETFRRAVEYFRETSKNGYEEWQKFDWKRTILEAIPGLGQIIRLTREFKETIANLNVYLGFFPGMDAAAKKAAQSIQAAVAASSRLSNEALRAHAATNNLAGGASLADQAMKALTGTAGSAKVSIGAVKDETGEAARKMQAWRTEMALATPASQLLAAQAAILRGELQNQIRHLAQLKADLASGKVGTMDLAEESRKLTEALGGSGAAMQDLSKLKIPEVVAKMGGIEVTAKKAGGALSVEIPAGAADGISKTKATMEREVPKLKAPWELFTHDVSAIVGNLERTIAGMLIEGDFSFASKFKAAAKSMAQAFADDFIAPVISATTNFLTGVLADLIGGKGFGGVIDRVKELGRTVSDVFKGISTPNIGLPGAGGGTAGTGIPAGGGGGIGGAGSALGSAASIASTVTAIGSVASAVSGIISNFQLAKQETSLNAIEANTRFAFVTLEIFRQDAWNRHEGLFHKLDDIWRTIGEGFGNAYVRLGDILDAALTKGDELIGAVRGLGTLLGASLSNLDRGIVDPLASIADQLRRAQSDKRAAEGERSRLLALHDVFRTLNELYGQLITFGPDAMTDALKVVGEQERAALAAGISDELQGAFSTLYGMIASGMGLDDASLFRQISTVTRLIQGEIEKQDAQRNFDQLSGDISRLGRTIERLERERAAAERNTIAFLVGVTEKGFESATDWLKTINATLLEKLTGGGTGGGGGAGDGDGEGGTGDTTPPAALTLREQLARVTTDIAALGARVDAARLRFTGDYTPSAEMVASWTEILNTGARDYDRLVRVRSDLEARLLSETPIAQRPIEVHIHQHLDGREIARNIVTIAQTEGGSI